VLSAANRWTTTWWNCDKICVAQQRSNNADICVSHIKIQQAKTCVSHIHICCHLLRANSTQEHSDSSTATTAPPTLLEKISLSRFQQ